jgi:hypothetical protein
VRTVLLTLLLFIDAEDHCHNNGEEQKQEEQKEKEQKEKVEKKEKG